MGDGAGGAVGLGLGEGDGVVEPHATSRLATTASATERAICGRGVMAAIVARDRSWTCGTGVLETPGWTLREHPSRAAAEMCVS